MPFKAVVVSTGGGAVVRPQNWGYMQHGVLAWLRDESELLARRALRNGISSRPMLANGGGCGRGRGGVTCSCTNITAPRKPASCAMLVQGGEEGAQK